MKTYKDLEVWIEAKKLANEIYSISKKFPKEEVYGITSQIRRCAISIPSNIAEGCGRQSSKETIRFLYISRGSLYELETQLLIANDQKYVEDDILENGLKQIETCKKLINGFINYYKKL